LIVTLFFGGDCNISYERETTSNDPIKTNSTSQSAFFHLRVLVSLITVLAGVLLALLALGAFSNAFAQTKRAKATPDATQAPRSKVGSQATAENFWVSTGGDTLALVTNANR
jgi:hypothetical protein